MSAAKRRRLQLAKDIVKARLRLTDAHVVRATTYPSGVEVILRVTVPNQELD